MKQLKIEQKITGGANSHELTPRMTLMMDDLPVGTAAGGGGGGRLIAGLWTLVEMVCSPPFLPSLTWGPPAKLVARTSLEKVTSGFAEPTIL